MNVKIIGEAGYHQSLLGVGLSRGLTSGMTLNDLSADRDLLLRLHSIAGKLVRSGPPHCKFLESIVVWLDITAPRYWWQQADTYRVGWSTQSESTMYSIAKRPLTQDDFEYPINYKTLEQLNALIKAQCFEQLKIELPEGYLQRRIRRTNYQALRLMIKQRHDHRLREWHIFCVEVIEQLEYPRFVRRAK